MIHQHNLLHPQVLEMATRHLKNEGNCLVERQGSYLRATYASKGSLPSDELGIRAGQFKDSCDSIIANALEAIGAGAFVDYIFKAAS